MIDRHLSPKPKNSPQQPAHRCPDMCPRDSMETCNSAKSEPLKKLCPGSLGLAKILASKSSNVSVKQCHCHKSSPSHQHFYRWYVYHSQKSFVTINLANEKNICAQTKIQEAGLDIWWQIGVQQSQWLICTTGVSVGYHSCGGEMGDLTFMDVYTVCT